MNNRKRPRFGFFQIMLLYGCIFVAVTMCGLALFWKYIESYEQSQPENAVRSYIDALKKDDLSPYVAELMGQLDPSIQTSQEVLDLIWDNAQTIRFVRKNSESTDLCQVYSLRSGRHAIGEITLHGVEAGTFGLPVWTVSEEHFDFSWMIGQPFEITIPEEYSAYINGRLLGPEHCVHTQLPYPALQEFYDDFDFPCLTGYRVEGYIGEPDVFVTDQEGAVVDIPDGSMIDTLLPECSEEDASRAETLINSFIPSYTAFTGGSSRDPQNDFSKLCRFIVPNGALASRLRSAIGGLKWAQSKGDRVKDLQLHNSYQVSPERIVCIIEYILSTTGHNGTVETTTNMKLVLVETAQGLKVEAMTIF